MTNEWFRYHESIETDNVMPKETMQGKQDVEEEKELEMK